jgi:hypothetical protein
MSVFAVIRSSKPSIRKFSSHEIFFERDCFQVIWINTVWNSAKMIYHKSFGDWITMKFKREPMSFRSFITVPKLSIAVNKRSGPKPTGFSLFNFSPKAINAGLHVILHNTVLGECTVC